MQKYVGRWCKLFGKVLSFAEEIVFAKEITGVVSIRYGQVHIRLDEYLPGWETPLWGSDDQWLFLRRPEGVWKVKLPTEHAGMNISVGLRDPNQSDFFTQFSIGEEWLSVGGWMTRECEPTSPELLDEKSSAENLHDVSVDEIGWPLLKQVVTGDDRSVYDIGSAFGAPPSLVFENGWVIGEDATSGRRVAFSVKGTGALENGKLRANTWLRFSCDTLMPFEVLVTC